MTVSATATKPTHRKPAPSMWKTVYLRAVTEKSALVAALGIYGFLIAIGMGALWLPLKDTMESIAADMPPAFDFVLSGLSVGTPVGWVNAELLSVVGPGFLIAAAMISAVSATASEEQDRTLGLALSTGVPRSTFFAAKTAAVITNVVIVGAAILAGMIVANAIWDLGLKTSHMIAATVAMELIALVYGSLTLLVGALTGDKRLSLAIPGAILAVSFISASFLGLVEGLEWLSKLNFWYPYLADTSLATGMDWGFAAVMALLSTSITAVAFFAFIRRADLRG